jgi:hypothetical protein
MTRAAVTSRASTLVAFSLLCAIAAPGYVTSWDYAFAVARPANAEFARAQTWFFLLAVQGAAWALCLAFLVDSLRAVWSCYHGRVRRLLALVVLPTLLPAAALFLYLGAAGTQLRPCSLAGITLPQGVPFAMFGTAIALVAVAGMFLVRSALVERADTMPVDVEAYLVLRSHLNALLCIAAVILSLGILGTAVLRSAVNAERGGPHFPADYVILYGGIYTLLLLIAYVPVKTSLWYAGADLVHSIMRQPPVESGAIAKWLEDKEKLEKAFNLDITSASALIGPIAVVLPLLSGWLSVLLEGRGAP